jgi:hypothetical protein
MHNQYCKTAMCMVNLSSNPEAGNMKLLRIELRQLRRGKISSGCCRSVQRTIGHTFIDRKDTDVVYGSEDTHWQGVHGVMWQLTRGG